ncbi:hypothetical protein T484DRAFT_1846247 [Baffinella frigidus]|nr:hypothetical protein T484DRAFT_1846247 [Cryptophyta sp. CCMP2293]
MVALERFISGPLVALRSGVVEARNRNLWPYNFLVDCFFFQTLWYTTVILVYIYSDVLPAWFVYETLSFTLFPIGRAAIVSTKYAFYGDIQLFYGDIQVIRPLGTLRGTC